MPTFTGKKEDFAHWHMKFMAIATMIGLAAALQLTPENELPATQAEFDALDLNQAGDKKKAVAWKRNQQAFAALTISLPGKLYRILTKAEGRAWDAMRQIHHDYQPRDKISLVEAEQRFDKMSMKEQDDPNTLLQKIAQIEADCPMTQASDVKNPKEI